MSEKKNCLERWLYSFPTITLRSTCGSARGLERAELFIWSRCYRNFVLLEHYFFCVSVFVCFSLSFSGIPGIQVYV